jgi:nucleotide-binding universal stress UspA family protein
MGMIKKILVPLDGSKLAEKALSYATLLTQKLDAELILVRVLPPLIIISDQNERDSYRSALLQKWEAEANSYLRAVQDQLRELGLPAQVEILEGGPVAEMILELACDRMIDLIVMSTHGNSGSDRWVYGSIANKVLEGASCPVFLVKAIANEV